MLNNKQKHYPEGNFWFGFLMGGILSAGCLFLFGTKKGRRLLKQILESTEVLEDSLSDIINELEEKIEDNKEELENKLSHIVPNENIDSVLQRIKSIIPVKKVPID